MSRAINWDGLPYGRMSDEEIARRIGVTRQAVGAHRRARNIVAASKRVCTFELTAIEREDLEALERGLALILDDERLQLTIASAHAVDRTPGWLSEIRRAQRARGVGRATAYRFCAPARRQWTPWMGPEAARTWLITTGWADAAEARINELVKLSDAALAREQISQRTPARAGAGA